MTVKKFNILDIATADFAFECFGSTLNELFENAALAMAEIMTDTTKVKPKHSLKFSLKADDLKALMFDFLSEILFLKDTKGMVFSKFDVKIREGKPCMLNCELSGEKWDRNKHEIRTEVKAATYHMMQIEQKNGRWRAQVVIDT
ncbi:MAG: archease [Candidatus Aenigmarchaeota archaeon]|nr:archease [Candidatus Aenigmarchaeota archaeon]